MKKWKKFISAVAISAFCCSAMIPIVGYAETSNCPPHRYIVYDTNKIILKSSHTVNGQDCRITYTEYYRSMECEKCGDNIINEHYKTEEKHSVSHTP